jgi:glyoxylase-like metal-dependent hydrolase (beta-lactamase superfamily II)
MSGIQFNRDFSAVPGIPERLSGAVRRVLCDNPGPYTFKGTSTFIVGDGDVALIDPGPSNDAHLAALLRALEGETVTHILITHRHLDHSPLAARLKSLTGARTCAFARGERPPDRQSEGLDAGLDRAFEPDVPLAHGDRIEGRGWSIEALHTPGHASDHLCYALLEEKALFPGDHVMAWSTSVIVPPDGNMGAYLCSLRLLLRRDERVYHPAHGPSITDPKRLVRAYLAHRRMREEAILKRLEAGDRTIGSIVEAVYQDLDPKLRGAAALSTFAHLEHLIEQDRATTDGPPTLTSEFRVVPVADDFRPCVKAGRQRD